MDLPILENVPQHEVRLSYVNTSKSRAVNNRSVQNIDTNGSANEASDTENQTNAEDYT